MVACTVGTSNTRRVGRPCAILYAKRSSFLSVAGCFSKYTPFTTNAVDYLVVLNMLLQDAVVNI